VIRLAEFGAVIALAMVTACVSTKPVSRPIGAEAPLEGKSVVLVEAASPDFGVVSSSNQIVGGLFPLIAGNNARAIRDAGNQVRADDHIEDPARAIGRALLEELVGTYHLKVADSRGIPVVSQEPQQLAKQYPDTDLIMAVITGQWGMLYTPTHLTRYDVWYSATAKLVDTQSGKRIREATCIHRPRYSPDAPTYEEMLENSGQRLVSAMKAAQEMCLESFRHSLIGDASLGQRN
jgi:hypothetical protein